MSENERKELSEKLHFGLALAERRMLEEKALRNECIIQGLNCLHDTRASADYKSTFFIPLNYNKKYIHSVFVILCRLYSLTRRLPHYVFDMLQTVVFHSYRILYSNYFVFGIISIYKIETITWCSMHKMDK